MVFWKILRTMFLILLLLLSLALLPAFAAPARYVLIDLGNTSPDDVAEDGTVVGSTFTAGQQAAILYPTVQPLGDTAVRANDIGGGGKVVVGYFGVGLTNHAYMWTRQGGIRDLAPGTTNFSAATDVTMLLVYPIVVGYIASETAPTTTPAVWAWGHQYTYRTLGGASGFATAINIWSEVVGQSENAAGEPHATLWWLAQPYDLTPDSSTGIANAINNNGWAVGSAQFPNGYHGFIWHPYYGTLNFGTLPGDITSEFFDINDHEDIVGTSIGDGGPPPPQRAIRIIQGRWDDLNTLVTAPGWTLETARAISNTGFIVGEGRFNGQRRGWLLQPAPESIAQR